MSNGYGPPIEEGLTAEELALPVEISDWWTSCDGEGFDLSRRTDFPPGEPMPPDWPGAGTWAGAKRDVSFRLTRDEARTLGKLLLRLVAEVEQLSPAIEFGGSVDDRG